MHRGILPAPWPLCRSIPSRGGRWRTVAGRRTLVFHSLSRQSRLR